MKKINKAYVVFGLVGVMTMGEGMVYSSGTPDINYLVAEEGYVEEIPTPTGDTVKINPSVTADGGQLAGQNVESSPSKEDERQHEAEFFGGQALALKKLIDEQNESPNPDQKELELLNAQYLDIMTKYNATEESKAAKWSADRQNKTKADVLPDAAVMSQEGGEAGLSVTAVEGVAGEQPIAKDQTASIPTQEAPVSVASGTAAEIAGGQPVAEGEEEGGKTTRKGEWKSSVNLSGAQKRLPVVEQELKEVNAQLQAGVASTVNPRAPHNVIKVNPAQVPGMVENQEKARNLLTESRNLQDTVNKMSNQPSPIKIGSQRVSKK